MKVTFGAAFSFTDRALALKAAKQYVEDNPDQAACVPVNQAYVLTGEHARFAASANKVADGPAFNFGVVA